MKLVQALYSLFVLIDDHSKTCIQMRGKFRHILFNIRSSASLARADDILFETNRHPKIYVAASRIPNSQEYPSFGRQPTKDSVLVHRWNKSKSG